MEEDFSCSRIRGLVVFPQLSTYMPRLIDLVVIQYEYFT